MSSDFSRRHFLGLSAGTAASLALTSCANTMQWSAPAARFKPKGSKLNIAVVGVGGRGYSLVHDAKGENIVALCDVDDRSAKKAFEEFPNAKRYRDWRVMLAELDASIDAVVIGTPDHMHAPIAKAAMLRGMHVYVEKPLTWSIGEARELAELAQKTGVATQMGNQGSAQDGFRRGVELLRSGVLGEIQQVIAWTDRPIWAQAIETPKDPEAVPAELDWDSWLGVANKRPFHAAYLPFNWRGWYDFGTGAFGDMACHILNLAWRGLDLGLPDWAAGETTKRFTDTYPAGSRILIHFPNRGGGKRGDVTITWYDGVMKPPREAIPTSLAPEMPTNGLFIRGANGAMLSVDAYGEKQTWEPAELGSSKTTFSVPRSNGHMNEWIDACKGGPAAYSNFDIAGPFTEAVLVGVLAQRTGMPILWDADGGEARGLDPALWEGLVQREYRDDYET
ncbi:MAG: Gfo/Idh/MocA family oxidoreductase [Planctomycetes bacterium]|nr:Gfo/Idh/MocA family oxidoreductase [Planctomycetota bacterium]